MNLDSPLARLKVGFYSAYRFASLFWKTGGRRPVSASIPAEAAQIDGHPICIFGRPFCVPLRRRTPSPPQKAAKGQRIPGGSARRIPLRESDSLRDTSGESLRGALLFHPAPPSCPSPISSVILHQRSVTQTAQLPQPNEKRRRRTRPLYLPFAHKALVRQFQNAVPEYGNASRTSYARSLRCEP